MLVATEAKAVVLRLRNPGRVTALIPTAREVLVGDERLIAVPHRLEEMRVLRNLGLEAPSPILYHYDWPGRYPPFDAQRRTAAFLTLNPRAFVFNEMGTGKTLGALWASEYLMRRRDVRRVLVVAPLSTLHSVWAEEIMFSFPKRTCAVLHGTAERRRKMLADDYDYYIINHDGVGVVQKELLKRHDIDLVIVDELDTYRNATNDLWEALNKVVNNDDRRRPMWAWGMTGTPMPNEPTDAWGQARLIKPGSVPAWRKQFKARVMNRVTQYKWIAKPDATEHVYSVLQPAMRIARKDCFDLPPVMYEQRHAELTPEQKKAYNEMLSKLKTELEAGQVLAVNEAVKIAKLVQIACGVAYGDNDERYHLPVGPRIKLVLEIAQQALGKSLVFVPFTGTLDLLERELGKHTTVARVDGSVTPNKRAEIFQQFQQDPALRMLIAQPEAMSHGLTLTEANTVIWYAPIQKAGVFDQANHRIIRAGQVRSQHIVTIEGTPAERAIYARLRAKQDAQGVLLELVRGGS